MTPAEIRAWVERSRGAQSLPAKITDLAVLSRLLTLLQPDMPGSRDDDRGAA
jgi:hypothetical protein